MAILHETPAVDATTALREAMGLLHDMFEQVHQRDLDGVDLHLTAPHRVVGLDRGHVETDDMLADPTPLGWRWLVVEGDEIIAAIRLVEGDDATTRVEEVNIGRLVPAFADALHAAEALEAVNGADFHLRYIEARALYLAAVWLVPVSGGEGIVIPLEDRHHAEITAHEPVSNDTLARALKAEADYIIAPPTDER